MVRDLTGAVVGDFAVERRLGRGGMGEVYLAKQISLDRPIALKVIRPDLVASPTTLARFEKEAWSAAQLNDPNIVHIYGIGAIDGFRYIAMEYVQGINLKDYIEKKGPPDSSIALSIMKQAAGAVRTAGEKGLIHRDLKPENILITKRGLVKVADFGLCRLQNDDGSVTLTQQGVTMGTPLYMSPEQAQGLPLDHRSDLYSLGVTFYHMLAGEPPFRADSPIALALKHVKDAPVDLAKRRPDLPPELCALVMKLIAKSPEDRHQSAAELLGEIVRLKEGLQTPSGAVPRMAEAVSPSGTDIPAVTHPSLSNVAPTISATTPRRGRWALPLISSLALIAGAGIGWKGRAEDLLTPGPEDSGHVPALWLAPDWERVPRRPTAKTQYRYAQIEAPERRRLSALVAVAGHHPRSQEWVSHAYTQLGRDLFRSRDTARLEAFAAELAKTKRSHDGKLAAILHVGGRVLRGDPDAVINDFGASFVRELADPELTELALEIASDSIGNVGRKELARSKQQTLGEIQRGLVLKLIEITSRDTWGRPLPL